MDLFFNPDLDEKSQILKFFDEEFHHITNVMRYSIGEEFFVTNGKGLIARVRLLSINKMECICDVIETQYRLIANKKFIALLPVLKISERFEFALEKLTELGVNEIIPFFSKRSIRKNFRLERSQKVIISAIKQSFNPFLPELSKEVNFEDYINSLKGDYILLYGYPEGEPLNKISYEKSLQNHQKIIFTVGPEGDFTQEEILLLKSKSGVPVKLGLNRLRSETAIICLFSQLKIFENKI